MTSEVALTTSEIHFVEDSSSAFNVSTEGKWRVRSSSLTKRATLFSSQIGAKLKLTFAQATSITALLLKHDWSGVCEVYQGQERTIIDLYSAVPGGELYELSIRRSTDAVTLALMPERNIASFNSELWFLGVKIDGRLYPIERGTPISKTCRIINGEWGTFIALRTDTGVAEVLADEGVWARHDIPIFRKAIRSGDIVLDIGANFGHHTVVFSQLTGATGHVIGFEPQSVMFRLLNANLVVNNIQNATVRQYAVGNIPGVFTMFPIDYQDQLNFGSFGINTNGSGDPTFERGEEVEVVRLDDVLVSLVPTTVPRVDFVKIDVQSFELFVLQGAFESLRLYKPILFLEIAPLWMQRAGYDFRDIYDFLHGLGYDISHPGMTDFRFNEIPDWDGLCDVEWDIFAVHPDNPRDK